MKTYWKFALCAIMLLSTSVASAAEKPLDPALEQELVELQRAHSLIDALNNKIALLEEERRRLIQGGANAAKLRTVLKTKNEELKDALALVTALNAKNRAMKAQLVKTGRANTQLAAQLDKAHKRLQIMERSMRAGGPVGAIRALPYGRAAAKALGAVTLPDELQPRLIGTVPFGIGKFKGEISDEGHLVIAEAVKLAKQGRLIGLHGTADAHRCGSYGKTHESCNSELADMRVKRVSAMLRDQKIVDFRELPGVLTLPKGFRFVEVWDLGLTNAALQSHFASKFKALGARVTKVESTLEKQGREIERLKRDVAGIKGDVTRVKTKTKAVYAAWREWVHFKIGAGLSVSNDLVGAGFAFGVSLAVTPNKVFRVHAIGQYSFFPEQARENAIDLDTDLTHAINGLFGMEAWFLKNLAFTVDLNVGSLGSRNLTKGDEAQIGVCGGLMYRSGRDGLSGAMHGVWGSACGIETSIDVGGSRVNAGWIPAGFVIYDITY